MASLHCFPIISVALLLVWHCALSLTQNADSSDMVECGLRLVMLAPCAPFVQGSIPSPTEFCCDRLGDLYHNQPNCLCVLLNDTANTITSFPINKTLAVHLPLLCNISLNVSTCPGLILVPDSPESQISRGTNSSSSSTAVSPSVALAPRSRSRSNMGFEIGRSGSVKLKFYGGGGGSFASAFTLCLLLTLVLVIYNS